jgi:hypothetical protein
MFSRPGVYFSMEGPDHRIHGAQHVRSLEIHRLSGIAGNAFENRPPIGVRTLIFRQHDYNKVLFVLTNQMIRVQNRWHRQGSVDRRRISG